MTTTILTTTLPPDLALRDQYRRAGQRLARHPHPGIARIVDVVIVPEGLATTVDVPEDATPLPGSLNAAEALALLSSVATALAHLHDAGFALGVLSRDSLRQRPNYSAVIVGWRPGADTASDVEDLAELMAELLPEGSVGSDVVSIMVSGADPDPAARPNMARMAAVLDLASRSLPVDRPAVAPGQSPLAVRRTPPMAEQEDMVWSSRRVGPTGAACPTRRSSPPGRQRATITVAPEPGRGRHAADGRRGGSRRLAGIRPRWLIAAACAGVVGFLGIGAVGADDATTGTCVVESTGADATVPPPPAESPKRSSNRSR